MSALPKRPWQEPSQICVTDDSVEVLYEKEKIRRELDGEKGFDTAIRLLGNPFVEEFKDSNIISLQVPGFGPDKSMSKSVDVHRKLAPLFLAAFEKIKAEKLPYELRTVGGHYFRYKLNENVRKALFNLPEYADLREKPGFAGSWNVLCAERDMKNQAFHQVVAYKNEMRAKRRMISFHAFGSAIDINEGYLVAARLMAAGREGDNPFLLEATEGRHLGFVLIRHELTHLKPTDASSSQPFPLYSLYMHLAPPQWGSAEADKEYEKAPWLAAFLKMQHGAVVSLDAASQQEVGKTFWALEPLKDDAESYKVRDRSTLLPVKKGGQLVGLAKPSPKHVTEAIEALKKGSIVTFDRPTFAVAAGDTIGFVAQGRPLPAPQGAPPGNSRPTALPRYLHWELFSPEEAGRELQALIDADDDLKGVLAELKEQKDKEDNFLRMPSAPEPEGQTANDIQQLFGSTGVEIVSELNNAYYGRRVQSYFNDGTKFFTAGDTRAQPFTWPLPLTLENKHKFAGEPGKECTLEVLYKKAGQPLSKESFTLSPKKDLPTLSVTLNVPAAADSLALWSPVFFADTVEVPAETLRDKRIQSRKELLKKAVKHRWRNLVLNHVNEWTPSGLVKQLEARNAAGFFKHLEDVPHTKYEDLKTLLLPLCWWDRPVTGQDPYGEVPLAADAQGNKNSLFGGGATQLPKAANVVNLHPVTALWLLDVLLEKEALAIRTEWPPTSLTRDEGTDKPLFVGLLHEGPAIFAGLELVAVLVQHGYGTTDGTTPDDVTFWMKGTTGAAPQALCRARYLDGVAVGRVTAPAWGQWECYATRAEGQRFEPDQRHGLNFEVPRPVLNGQPFELGTKTGKLRQLATGTLTVRENLPVALAGYVVFEYWKLPPREKPDVMATSTPATLAMPVIANRPPEDRTAGGLKYKKNLIVGLERKGSNPSVTTSYTFRDFVKRPKSNKPVFDGDAEIDFKLAVPLAQRLQELKDLCKPAKGIKTKELQITVTWLSADGLSLLVAPTSEKTEDLKLLVEKLPMLRPSELHSAEPDEKKKAVRLTYHQPASAGVLNLEFDPALALGRLAAEALSGEVAGEVLHVC